MLEVVIVLGGQLTFKFGSSGLVRHLRQHDNNVQVYTVSGHKAAPIDGCTGHIVWDDTDAHANLLEAVGKRVKLGSVSRIIDSWVGEPIEWHPGSQYTMSRYERVLQLLAGAADGCVLQIPVHTRALHCMFLVCGCLRNQGQLEITRGDLDNLDDAWLQAELMLLSDHSPVGAWCEDRCGELRLCLAGLAEEGLFVNFHHRKI